MSRMDPIWASLKRALHREQQTLFLRPSLVWSRAILWTIIGSATGLLLWACLAHMEEVVHATGKLEPHGTVQDVQSPVAGVISAILIEEGAQVKAGQPLVLLDQKVATAEVKSLEDRLAAMRAEREFYDQLVKEKSLAPVPGGIPREIADLAKNRNALIEENNLLRRLRDQIGGLHEAIIASESAAATTSSDPVASKLGELKTLIAQKPDIEVNSDHFKFFNTELTNLAESYLRLRAQLEEARNVEKNRKLSYEAFLKLYEHGNLARVDLLAKQADWMNAKARVKDLEDQAKNTPTTFKTESNNRIRENSNRIAEIDTSLTKLRLDNIARISETESRLTAAREVLGYHEIKSPSDGIVFEVVATKPGTVLAAKDIVLKIVPSEELVAKVDITNRDIGFIRTGLASEVEIASFSAREYGRINGQLYFVGSDALPPTQAKPFYSFPAKISLERQSLEVRRLAVPLQSGMAVSANIKVRNRRVITLFLDYLLGPLDRIKEVR